MNYKRISPKYVSSAEYKLTKQQKQFYEENGYLLFRNLFESTSLDRYRKRFSELCHQPEKVTIIKENSLVSAKKTPEEYVYKIQDIINDEVYMSYSEDSRVLDIVSQLIGDDISAVNLMLINKPPESTRHPAHQDQWYFPFGPTDKIIAMWTALDPANLQNGCLYIVPGSHKCGKLFKHVTFKNSKKFFHVIADEDQLAPLSNRLYLEMSPGDTVFFHPYLIHGSGPNDTKDYRKALTIHYANSACHYVDLRGTVQEELSTEFQREGARRGITGFDYSDYWKLKIKAVRGPRCNL
ncbi:probable phytanoyl-CoA dioxygenase isoform X2 [Bombyx mori]|uniref:phytanoyl-CoA dioxygenase n=1 Tax=Bombyx mori TaxID=7091 RepID=A0A8R2DQE6_BOMMO|nr:probable phytanoyl-CoA dioxygenase [Bombyx mori]